MVSSKWCKRETKYNMSINTIFMRNQRWNIGFFSENFNSQKTTKTWDNIIEVQKREREKGASTALVIFKNVNPNQIKNSAKTKKLLFQKHNVQSIVNSQVGSSYRIQKKSISWWFSHHNGLIIFHQKFDGISTLKIYIQKCIKAAVIFSIVIG